MSQRATCANLPLPSPMLLQWGAPLPPTCRWLRAPLTPFCKWFLGLLLSGYPTYFYHFPITSVASLGILSGSPLGSFCHPFKKQKKPGSQPGHTVRLAIRLIFSPCILWLFSLPSFFHIPPYAEIFHFLLLPYPICNWPISSPPSPCVHCISSPPLPLHPWGQRNGFPMLYDSRTMG